MENKVLGKGLSALIPERTETKKGEIVSYLKIDAIKDSHLQPRIHYNKEKLDELVASIKEKGVLQPILVREKNSQYEVIAGERRLKAARLLGMREIPAIIKSVSDKEALVIALVENIQREELNPIEEAQAFKKLIEEFQFTQEEVAVSVGKDRSTISNTLRLLKLPLEIQKAVSEEKISMGHARALINLELASEQKRFFELVVKKSLSVRELENLVKKGLRANYRRGKTLKAKPQEVVALEEALQKYLGTKVRIVPHKKRGRIEIEYYSLEDLERILRIIKR